MKLGFIGTGTMASAIIGGIINNKIAGSEEIIGSDLFGAGCKRVKEQCGIGKTSGRIIQGALGDFYAVYPALAGSEGRVAAGGVKSEKWVIVRA